MFLIRIALAALSFCFLIGCQKAKVEVPSVPAIPASPTSLPESGHQIEMPATESKSFALNPTQETQRKAAKALLSPTVFTSPSKLEWEEVSNFVENCKVTHAHIVTIDPVTQLPRKISVEVYRNRPAVDRAVLILPPTGGKNRLDEQWGEQFCEKGIDAWIITHWDTDQKDYALVADILSHDIAGRRGVLGVRQVVGHMNYAKLGILGTSAGGILASVCLAVEPKFSVGVFIAAGADMPGILTESDEVGIKKLREDRMASNKWSTEDYRRKLSETLVLDPRLFEKELLGKKVGTVVATEDKTVPTKNQILLEKISRGERLGTFGTSHFQAILQMDFLFSYQIVRFFDDSFKNQTN